MTLNFRLIGIIRTALPNMDREAKEEYHVVIQAKDMGGHMGGLSVLVFCKNQENDS